MVPQTDRGERQEVGTADGKPRDHIQARKGGQGQWRRPVQEPAPRPEASQEASPGKTRAHQGQGIHRPQAEHSGREEKVWGLGNRHDRGQGKQGRHSHHHGKDDGLPGDGETKKRKKREIPGDNGDQSPFAIQKTRADDHFRQWDGIRRTPGHSGKTRRRFLLRPSLFFLGKGIERVHKQAHKTVYSEKTIV